MQDKLQDAWAKFLKKSLKNVTDEELATLDKIGFGQNDDPAETMEHIFAAVENEIKNRRIVAKAVCLFRGYANELEENPSLAILEEMMAALDNWWGNRRQKT